MYANAKMIPVETIPGIRGGGIKERDKGVNLSMIYLVHCKNLCKCHNVPPPSTAIEENKFKNKKPLKIKVPCNPAIPL
jgi:hypothetical protein